MMRKNQRKKISFFPRLRSQKDKHGERLFVDWPADISGTGKIRREYFGRADDPRSRARYAEARRVWEEARAAEARKEETEQKARSGGIIQAALIAELIERYLIYAEERYQKHGKKTGTKDNIWYTLRPFLARYGAIDSADFGLDELEEYQRELDAGGKLCRNQINARIRIIIAMFTWGARHRGKNGQRMVPPAVAGELRLIEKLRRGYCRAKDHPRKGAAPLEDIEKTAAELAEPIASMVRLQLLTGARPNEIREMKAREITKAGRSLWEYRPESYKTEHQEQDGERKIIFLGPKAVKILRPFMAAAEKEGREDYLFRPAQAAAERRRQSEAINDTKTPSRRERDAQRARKPGRRLNDHYTATAYRTAIKRGAERAGVPDFTPYQIRKARATEIDRKYGEQAAAIQLGHKSIRTTLDHYIDPRTEQARKLARKIG